VFSEDASAHGHGGVDLWGRFPGMDRPALIPSMGSPPTLPDAAHVHLTQLPKKPYHRITINSHCLREVKLRPHWHQIDIGYARQDPSDVTPCGWDKKPLKAMSHDFLERAPIGRYYRQPARHGLDHRLAEV